MLLGSAHVIAALERLMPLLMKICSYRLDSQDTNRGITYFQSHPSTEIGMLRLPQGYARRKGTTEVTWIEFTHHLLGVGEGLGGVGAGVAQWNRKRF